MDIRNIVMLDCNIPNKLENKLYFTVGTNPKSDRIIEKNPSQIDPTNIFMTAHVLSLELALQ
jgi:hypothetical protein